MWKIAFDYPYVEYGLADFPDFFNNIITSGKFVQHICFDIMENFPFITSVMPQEEDMNKTAQEFLDQYQKYLQKSLLAFQFTEEVMKMYLSCSFQIIHEKVKGLIEFDYTYADVKKHSMGRLFWQFQKYNNNKETIEKISNIIQERNHCAHQAFLMTSEETTDIEFLSKEALKMKNTFKKADECLKAVMLELKKQETISKNVKKRLA